MAEANGERRLGHIIIANLNLIYALAAAVVAFAAGYGAAWASNGGDHGVLREHDKAIEGRITRCEEWQRDVGVKLDKISTSLSEIKGALGTRPGK